MLSVITITYNNFDELICSSNSLINQKIQQVIVNGGSDRATMEYLARFSSVSVSEKDSGISDAFNKGFKLASGEYIAYLNSGDVLIDSNYYHEAVELFEKNPLIDFIYADICFVDQYAGEIRVRSGNKLPNMPFLHPTLIVRKSVMEKIGLFNLEYKIAMDLDFAYRLVNSGAKGYYVPRMVVKMDGSGVSSKNHTRAYAEVMKIIYRNKDFSFRSFKFVVMRTISLFIKILILKFKGDKLLGWYRKRRYQISS